MPKDKPKMELIDRLKQGHKKWGKWRSKNRHERPNLSRLNLSGLDLAAYDLSDCDMQESNLCGADLTWSNMTSANLSGALCIGANFKGARLIGTDMRRTNLTSANLVEVEFSNLYGLAADLTGAVLTHAILTPKTKAIIDGGFLELASTIGLETVEFGEPGALIKYLCDAFEYAHNIGFAEPQEWSRYVNEIVQRIRCLQNVLSSTGDPPSLLHETIISINSQIIREFRNHPERLFQLTPRQFEELIAELLASFGWQVNLTAQTKDGGYDLFAISKDRIVGVETSWLIECKKYARNNPVRIDAVRSLYGARQLQPSCNLLFATTSFFTQDVYKFKSSTYDLTLKDYDGIIEWINAYRPPQTGGLVLTGDMH